MKKLNMSEKIIVLPNDIYNQQLVSHVHPSDWVNPIPKDSYHLVVIGAGTAGLVTAAGAAGLGAKVALIENHLFGGDCLNVGCVPSKSVIRSARLSAEIKNAVHEYGLHLTKDDPFFFSKTMERMRKLRAQISPNDSVQRFKNLGVDVFLGSAQFTSNHFIQVGTHQLRFKKAVIATGARAAEPFIPGLKEAGFLTNETIFSLTTLPEKLAVIGAGPIGCELAQSFQRLGSQVYLIHKNPHILDREDSDAAAILQKKISSEGVQLFLNSSVVQVEKKGFLKKIFLSVSGKEFQIDVDQILVGAGRVPNVEELGLENVNVHYDRVQGISVNDYLQTTHPKIYAVGDVCMQWKFTHAADFAARIAIQNTLFFGRKKLSSLLMPWCTYTDPEIAHVGLYPVEAQKKGIEIDTFVRPLNEVDRAVLDGESEGFVKIHVKKGTDKILGATLVSAHAGELISEISVAMAAGMGLGKMANVIHPYPTQSEAIRQLGDIYNRTRLTSTVKKFFKFWFEKII